MEYPISEVQARHSEPVESTGVDQDGVSTTETTEDYPVDTTIDADTTKREKLKEHFINLGGFAVVSALTYGALKSGHLDSLPIAHTKDEGMIGFSMTVGAFTTELVKSVNSYRNK